tara:strand:+ start:8148 stop:8543 length:396 start_codon:yes stop_codon:yes gene_type:complete
MDEQGKALPAATRDGLLAMVGTAGLKRAAVDIPDWGMTVHIRELSGAAFDQFVETFNRLGGEKAKSPARIRAVITVASAVDSAEPDAGRMFEDKDLETVLGLPPSGLKLIADAAIELNGMSDEAAAAVGKD